MSDEEERAAVRSMMIELERAQQTQHDAVAAARTQGYSDGFAKGTARRTACAIVEEWMRFLADKHHLKVLVREGNVWSTPADESLFELLQRLEEKDANPFLAIEERGSVGGIYEAKLGEWKKDK